MNHYRRETAVAMLGELAAVCGASHVRSAGPGDAAAGVASSVVAAPADPVQLGAVLRIANEHGLTVVPRGAGTKLDWGVPPSSVDIMVDLNRLRGTQSHDRDDRCATFAAGTPLREIDAVLAPAGQRLALDPPSATAGATVGGILAAAETGPLRHLTGPVTDLVLGVEYVRADGERREADGAEAAALCGSLGTLGVISAATFRLHARPGATAWVRRSVRHPAELYELLMLLETTPLNVSAIEADWPAVDPVLARVPRPRPTPEIGTPAIDPRPAGPGSLAVQIEGTPAGVADRSRTAVTLLGGDAVTSPLPPQWWGRDPTRPESVALRLAAPPAALYAVGYSLRDATVGAASLRGAMGAGVIIADIPGELPAGDVVNIVEAIRYTLTARDGRCTVLRAPAEVHYALMESDRFAGMARGRKERFDPAGRLCPGRLPLSDAAG